MSAWKTLQELAQRQTQQGEDKALRWCVLVLQSVKVEACRKLIKLQKGTLYLAGSAWLSGTAPAVHVHRLISIRYIYFVRDNGSACRRHAVDVLLPVLAPLISQIPATRNASLLHLPTLHRTTVTHVRFRICSCVNARICKRATLVNKKVMTGPGVCPPCSFYVCGESRYSPRFWCREAISSS